MGDYANAIAVDLWDLDVAYCTVSNFCVPHVFRTKNGGRTPWISNRSAHQDSHRDESSPAVDGCHPPPWWIIKPVGRRAGHYGTHCFIKLAARRVPEIWRFWGDVPGDDQGGCSMVRERGLKPSSPRVNRRLRVGREIKYLQRRPVQTSH